MYENQGLGKTTLAVAWAHSVATRFRDGQLYFNLRGFDPAGQPCDPAEAVRTFLDALDIAPSRIPSGLDAQIGLYRSLLAGRRILVVLDNARDEDQVRPLLPGSPHCATIVTSRNRLPGLVVQEGAHPLTLGVLSDVDARDLVTRRIGHADPATVDAIVSRCAGLPLALAIAAGHAALDPGLSPAEGLDGGELTAVFDCSYRALGPAAARLFRLLGLHPWPEISAHAAASLAGIPLARARTLLSELTRANLLSRSAPGRYALHDLLHAFAIELAAQDGPDRDAGPRMLDHYLHTALAATLFLIPLHARTGMLPPGEGVALPDLEDRAAALRWLRAEHSVLLKVLAHAAGAGADLHTWQLAWVLTPILDLQGQWRELRETQRLATEAARRLDDPRLEATALRLLAAAERRLADYDAALEHLGHAHRMFRELGDIVEEAHTEHTMSGILGEQGRPGAALLRARRSLALFKAKGHRLGQAKALSILGWNQALLGRFRAAVASCEKGLALTGASVAIEGPTLDILGVCHHRLGDHERALSYFRRSLVIFRELGDRFHEAIVLNHLGDAYDTVGEAAAAIAAWREALALLDQLGHPDATQTQARLQKLMRPGNGEGRLVHHGGGESARPG